MALASDAPSVGGNRELLRDAWLRFTKDNEDVSMRDGARRLGASEAEVLSACAGDGTTTQLAPDFQAFNRTTQNLGRVMSLVRNDDVVIMPIGELRDLKLDGAKGRMCTDIVELTFDISKWGSVFGIVRNAHNRYGACCIFSISGEKPSSRSLYGQRMVRRPLMLSSSALLPIQWLWMSRAFSTWVGNPASVKNTSRFRRRHAKAGARISKRMCGGAA